jgi:hypothetical protein
MSCDRFERERLAAVEDGAVPDEHEQACADCTEARRRYLGIGELVAAAGADRELPAAWFDATLAMIRARSQRRRRQRLLVGAAGMFAAAAAAAAAVLWWPHHADPDAPPLLAIRIDRSGAPLRGSAPHPGDLLVVRGQAAGRRHMELRVYRADREVVLRCATEPPCHPSGDAVEAGVALIEAGRYRAVLLSTDRPLPPADATLDQAAAQVSEEGGTATLSEPIDVL